MKISSLYYSQTCKSTKYAYYYKVSKSTQWLSQQGENLTGIYALNVLLFIPSDYFLTQNLTVLR